MKLRKIFGKLYEKNDLSFEESEHLFRKMLTGEVPEDDITNILLALKLKSETSDEIAGAVKVMDEFKVNFPKENSFCVDTCGTGGDGKNCLNISTAVAITVSADGIPVVKHGNCAQSGKIGSADILDLLGIPVKLDLQSAKKFFQKNNFVFLYAPQYHPSMKYVIGARKKLKVRTIFNFLGPLVNPANPDFQIIGIGDRDKLNVIADALIKLKRKNVILYSSFDGYDEISSIAPTQCYEINGNVKNFTIFPEDYFIPFKMPVIKDKNDAIARFMEAISGKNDNLAKLIALNSSLIFYKVKKVSLKIGYEYAYNLIKSGKVLEKFYELKGEREREVKKVNVA